MREGFEKFEAEVHFVPGYGHEVRWVQSINHALEAVGLFLAQG